MKKKKIAWVLFVPVVLIITSGFAVYLNCLRGEFIWDDAQLIQSNTYIRGFSYLKNIFTEDMGAGSATIYGFYRPLQIFTYAIDYSLWGLNTIGYHLTNLILHILAALALYWLISILFKDRILSLLSSLFFVIHPVHTEAVSYVSGRGDLLSLLFVALAFIFYIKQLELKSRLFYILAILSFILAILSKENAVIMPFLLLLYHYAFKKKINFKIWAVLCGIAGAYILFRASVLTSLSAHPLSLGLLCKRAPGFLVALTNYLRILFFPVGLHAEYGNRLFSFLDPKAVLGIALLFALFIYAYKNKGKNRLFFFALGWFFITLLPSSGIYPVCAFYMAEHWLYFPCVGFFIIIASGLTALYRSGRFKYASVLITILLLFFYSYLTIRQNNYWRDKLSFYRRTLLYAPDNYKVYNNLCNACLNAGLNEEAVRLCAKAIELKPDFTFAYYNLGEAYHNLGRNQEALMVYSKGVGLSPRDAYGYNKLGLIYLALGMQQEAIEEFQKAVEISPQYTDASDNLANAQRLHEK